MLHKQKRREDRLLFTLLKGFAIPANGRKTIEVHAKYAKTLHTKLHEAVYYIPTGPSIVTVPTISECCEDSE